MPFNDKTTRQWSEKSAEDVAKALADECYACGGTLTPSDHCYRHSDGREMQFVCSDCVEAILIERGLDAEGPPCPYCGERDHIRVATSAVGTIWMCEGCALSLERTASWSDEVV